MAVPILAPESGMLWSRVGTEVEPGPFDGSGRPWASGLCGDTCWIDTSPGQSVLGHFGDFEGVVHFCSFRSFWECGE